jgi:hypothetical protein
MRLHQVPVMKSDPLYYFRSHLIHAQTISRRLKDGRGTAAMSRENMDLHIASMRRLASAPEVAAALRADPKLAEAYRKVSADPVGRS